MPSPDLTDFANFLPINLQPYKANALAIGLDISPSPKTRVATDWSCCSPAW